MAESHSKQLQVDRTRQQIEYWFFKELSDEQRSALIGLVYGNEIQNQAATHFSQKKLLVEILERTANRTERDNTLQFVADSYAKLAEGSRTITELALERLKQLVDMEGKGGHDTKYKFSKGRIVNRVSGEAIPEDEPIMIFRARDVHALDAISHYMSRLNNVEHIEVVDELANAFEKFASDHPDRMREPTTSRPQSQT